jgi:Glycosyltransferases involved in cell wall biogenesis
MKRLVSVVVPMFNEQDNINEFYKRITEVMSALPYEYELIFVDDGSKDKTALLLNELVQKDSRVQAYLFSRNFGHQLALTCGLDHGKICRGFCEECRKH